jgi:hypothetical protein
MQQQPPPPRVGPPSVVPWLHSQISGSVTLAMSQTTREALTAAVGKEGTLLVCACAVLIAKATRTDPTQFTDLVLVRAVTDIVIFRALDDDVTSLNFVNAQLVPWTFAIGVAYTFLPSNTFTVFAPTGDDKPPPPRPPLRRLVVYTIAIIVDHAQTDGHIQQTIETVIFVATVVTSLSTHVYHATAAGRRLDVLLQICIFAACDYCIVGIVNLAHTRGLVAMLVTQHVFVLFFEFMSHTAFSVVKPIAIWKTADVIAKYMLEETDNLAVAVAQISLITAVLVILEPENRVNDFISHTGTQALIYTAIEAAQRTLSPSTFLLMVVCVWICVTRLATQ